METAQVFATVLNELEDLIIIMKVEHQQSNFSYFYANKRALQIGNITEEDYGKLIDQILPKELSNRLKVKYNEAIQRRDRIHIQDELKLNGNTVGETSVTPIFSDDGTCEFLKVVGSFNKTEQKLNEEKLFRANNMLDSFLTSSGDGILLLDLNNRVSRVNKAYLEMFGFVEEDVLRQTPQCWQTVEDAKEFLQILQLVKQGKEFRDYQTTRKRKDGLVLDISATYSPFRNSTGDIIGVITSIRDINDRQKIKGELRKSHEQYQLITENMLDIIAVVDDHGIIKYVSPSCVSILEQSSEQLIGKRAHQFIDASIKAVRDKFHNSLNSRKTDYFEFEFEHFLCNGNSIWLDVKCTPVLGLYGEIDHFVLVGRDITLRKQTEKDLKESKERYRLIARNTSDLIKAYNLDGIIEFASPSHQKMIGVSHKEIIGKSIFEFIHPDDEKMTRDSLKFIRTSQESKLLQKRLRTESGEWINVESIITPIINEEGNVESYLGVSRNITDRLKNEELIRNLDRLSIIGQLAAGVAHEIRNPLTALKGFSKILNSTLSNTEQKRYLHIMLDELDRIDLIVNEFMSLAKPQAVEYKEANIVDLIQGIITVFQTQAALHNILIKSSIQEDQETFIRCQPNQIKQVFMNFMKNAIEAMDHGGIIEVLMKETINNKILIQIKDQGIGIEEERLKYLGTPFYTTKEKGIGLGLTISNKIIKEHDGEMTIKSKPNEGTTVEVSFPVLVKNLV